MLCKIKPLQYTQRFNLVFAGETLRHKRYQESSHLSQDPQRGREFESWLKREQLTLAPLRNQGAPRGGFSLASWPEPALPGIISLHFV